MAVSTNLTCTRFHGATAMVTGALAGIGAAITERLAQEGANIVALDVDAERGEQLVRDLARRGTRALFVPADVKDSAAVDHAVCLALDRFHQIDMAVNNAGVNGGPMVPLFEMPDSQWRHTMSINLDGVFYCLRAEMRAMLGRGGAIVNIASVMGLVGMAHIGHYATSKHAVIGLTKVAALDGAPHNIRVNAVAPTFVRTALMDGVSEEAWRQLLALHPLGRFPTADEIASLVVYLLSNDAQSITGSTHLIDSGLTAQ